jgi:hypothetical protein
MKPFTAVHEPFTSSQLRRKADSLRARPGVTDLELTHAPWDIGTEVFGYQFKFRGVTFRERFRISDKSGDWVMILQAAEEMMDLLAAEFDAAENRPTRKDKPSK